MFLYINIEKEIIILQPRVGRKFDKVCNLVSSDGLLKLCTQNSIYYKPKNGNTDVHLLCVFMSTPSENIKNAAIWYVWSTFPKFSLK